MGNRIGCIIFIMLILASCSSGKNYAPVVDAWKQTPGAPSYYIVQKGDTLYSIAWAFERDYRDLAGINNIAAPYTLHPGQKLSMTQMHVPKKIPLKGTSRNRLNRHPRASGDLEKPCKYWIPAFAGMTESGKNAISRGAVKKTKKIPPKIHHWLWPAQGKVKQKFALQSSNKGIDINGRFAEPITASAGGIVVYSGSGLRGYGNLIIIKHNADFLSAYAHNEHILVTEGQTVRAGQKIATMGRTNGGQVVLHFEIRHNGKPVNPLRYLG